MMSMPPPPQQKTAHEQLTEILQSTTDRIVLTILLPVISQGLQQRGFNVTVDDLKAIIAIPAAPASPFSLASTPMSSMMGQAPRQAPRQVVPKQPPPNVAADPNDPNYGDQYVPGGCLYVKKRGDVKYVFCGKPTMENSPVCSICAEKRDGKELLAKVANNQWIDIEALRRDTTTKRQQNAGKTPIPRAKAAGKGRQPPPIPNMTDGSMYARPPPFGFTMPPPASSGPEYGAETYSGKCELVHPGEKVYRLLDHAFVVRQPSNGNKMTVIGYAQDSTSDARKLTAQDQQRALDLSLVIDPAALQDDVHPVTTTSSQPAPISYGAGGGAANVTTHPLLAMLPPMSGQRPPSSQFQQTTPQTFGGSGLPLQNSKYPSVPPIFGQSQGGFQPQQMSGGQQNFQMQFQSFQPQQQTPGGLQNFQPQQQGPVMSNPAIYGQQPQAQATLPNLPNIPSLGGFQGQQQPQQQVVQATTSTPQLQGQDPATTEVPREDSTEPAGTEAATPTGSTTE